MSALFRWALAASIWVWVLSPDTLAGQISPGPLSEAHAQLEGNDQCLHCHSQKKRVSRDLCLECHRILGERIESRLGYHATVGDQGCEKCHMEHHGREFELVWWGDDGQRAFDHEQTGYSLEGAHRNLECRQCHQAKLVADRGRFRRQGKNLETTFLGLDASACIACHADPHRGQFEPRKCEQCHTSRTWKDVTGFQHQETRFPLRGRHERVECAKCHARTAPAGGSQGGAAQVQYSGLRFGNCSDCHKDPHAGRLGKECQRCHTEGGWQAVELDAFDHRRARFALEGAHRRVQCRSCHRQGASYRIARFEACTDCHRDSHLGQFVERADGGVCTACHDLEAFSPSTFTLEAHQASRYPLEKAHLAVACNACHQQVPASEIATMTGRRSASANVGSATTARFVFASTLCSGCHLDPHQGALSKLMEPSGCTECHEIGGWSRVLFDHDKTDYRLEAGHQRPGCRECHEVEATPGLPLELRFDGLAQECTACHEDPHAGQFASRGHPEYCRDCHILTNWKQTVFDHGRDSRYALDGVHATVACRSCHPSEQLEGRQVVRYRPLAMSCADCHSGTRSGGTTTRSR